MDTNDVLDGLEVRTIALSKGISRRAQTGRLDQRDREQVAGLLAEFEAVSVPPDREAQHAARIAELRGSLAKLDDTLARFRQYGRAVVKQAAKARKEHRC